MLEASGVLLRLLMMLLDMLSMIRSKAKNGCRETAKFLGTTMSGRRDDGEENQNKRLSLYVLDGINRPVPGA